MYKCCSHVCKCTTCVPVPVEARGGCQVPWNWSTDSGEPPCRYWELNLDLLEEEPVLLIAEPSLSPCKPTNLLLELWTNSDS